MALATYSIVAWRLLWLTYLARFQPDASCELVLATHEWQVLYTTIHHQLYPHTTPPTLAQVVNWIARLGGFFRSQKRWLSRCKSSLAWIKSIT
nr:IS4 family transposase [Nostoc edaphicum]